MFAVSAVHLGMKEEIRVLVGSGVAARRQWIEADQALRSTFVLRPFKLPLLPVASIGHCQAVVLGKRLLFGIFQNPLDTVAYYQ